MTKRTIDKEMGDKISFISFIIPEFALAYKMNVQKAYKYLKQYGGMDYLNKHWWALHTDNPFWAVRSMYEICHRNGGIQKETLQTKKINFYQSIGLLTLLLMHLN